MRIYCDSQKFQRLRGNLLHIQHVLTCINKQAWKYFQPRFQLLYISTVTSVDISITIFIDRVTIVIFIDIFYNFSRKKRLLFEAKIPI